MRPQHADAPRRHPALRAVALTVTAVLAFGVVGAATAYTHLQGNITSADVEHLLGDRPTPVVTPDPEDPNQGMPVNILVLGSDTREGSEDLVTDPGQEGQRSDTTIVVHISADRDRMELVSIPRDSLVDIPMCERSDGTSSRPREAAMFNSAYQIGGESGEVTDAAACTQRTVESLTGVYIDHFVVVNMTGFVAMVNALGGVPMCIPNDMYSRKARLDLKAGQQTLDGVTALAFARARTGEGLGNGSDLNRIERQQEMLAATARTVLSKNLLTDVPELLRFLDAATDSLTVSAGIGGIPDMAGLALSLRGISSENIAFMTIPNRTAPSDPNRVVWTDDADDVWAKIAADEPLFPQPPVPGTADGGDDSTGSSTGGGTGSGSGTGTGTGATSGTTGSTAGSGAPDTTGTTTTSAPARTSATAPTTDVDPITPADDAVVCG